MKALLYRCPGSRAYEAKPMTMIRVSTDGYRRDREDNHYGSKPADNSLVGKDINVNIA